jgi:uncharacterized protein
MITRDDAIKLLDNYVKDDKILKHSIAVEAIMKSLAKFIREDITLWSVVGLLHDLDYEYTKGNPETHTKLSAEILEGLLPEQGINAIQSQNYIHTDVLPTTLLDKSLIAANALSELIITTTLTTSSKKISDIDLNTLRDKFNDQSFAKECNRDRIKLCLDCDIPLEDFLSLGLQSLKEISAELKL